MADIILVVAEQRDGKLNRVSFETIAAAQAIAKETGWAVEVVLPGSGISELAQELATKAVGKVTALESDALAQYTSDATVAALKAFVEEKQPKLVLFPHTYQVRDFAPRLALALDRTLISDATGYKYESGRLLFTRQMFQGKFAADVSFGGDGYGADWGVSGGSGGGWIGSGRDCGGAGRCAGAGDSA
jgi:electron transfer flavoprotein alpha subunit